MLYIWCNTDATALKKVIGAVVARHEIPHQVVKVVGNSFPLMEKGDVTLACGGVAVDVFKALGMVQKNRTIGSLREKPMALGLGKCFVTYDSGIVSRDYTLMPEIQWDTELAIRLHNTGTVNPVIGEYRWVEDFNDVVEVIETKFEQTGKPVDVACDLETLSLDEYSPEAWIISISFTVENGRSDLMYFAKGETLRPNPDPWEVGVWEQVNWILTTEKVSTRGANFKYDSRWMNRKWGINCTNHKFDTMLVGSLLDENRSNSLKLHAKIMTKMGGYDEVLGSYDMGRMDLVPKPVLVSYAGGDTDVTYQVANVMKSELLKDKSLTNFYVRLLHPASKAFEKMERNGIYVDVEYYKRLELELIRDSNRLREAMLGCIPRKIQFKYADKIEKSIDEDKSPITPALLKAYMFSDPNGLKLTPLMKTAKTKEPSTAVDHLMMFADNPDAKAFIDLFKEYGSVAKTLSTYIVGFMKHLRSDGRFHPTYMLHRGEYGGDDKDSGAVTGRTSAKDPAVQTIPKHTTWTKKLRRGYIAPPGYTILQCDYSQGELKITACLANEPKMLAAYKNGADLHAITAARLNGYTMEEFLALPSELMDELRSGGKAGNFGLIYGMGAEGYRAYAFNSYGVSLTADQAFEQRESFFELYSALPEWHETYKNRAKQFGYVRSPLGRIRHLPLISSKDREMQAQAERQAINSPVQSCLSDMMQLAMVYIDKEYGDEDIHTCLMTHDSLALYVRIEDAVMWAGKINELMGNLPLKRDFGWDHQLQFTADAEIAMPDAEGVRSLATLTKLKKYMAWEAEQ